MRPTGCFHVVRELFSVPRFNENFRNILVGAWREGGRALNIVGSFANPIRCFPCPGDSLKLAHLSPFFIHHVMSVSISIE